MVGAAEPAVPFTFGFVGTLLVVLGVDGLVAGLLGVDALLDGGGLVLGVTAGGVAGGVLPSLSVSELEPQPTSAVASNALAQRYFVRICIALSLRRSKPLTQTLRSTQTWTLMRAHPDATY
jgi:hypothetical protein